MVDDAFLDAARDGCVLVNVARGGLFQPDGVPRFDGKTKTKTKTKKLAFVASDVAWEEPADPTHPLIAHARAYFTPHVGGVTDVSYRRMGQVVCDVARCTEEGLAFLEARQRVRARERASAETRVSRLRVPGRRAAGEAGERPYGTRVARRAPVSPGGVLVQDRNELHSMNVSTVVYLRITPTATFTRP